MKNNEKNFDMSFDEDSFFEGTNAPDQNFKNSVVSYPRNEQGFN